LERFRCPSCQRSYDVEATRWRCDCGSYLDLEFTPRLPLQDIQRRPPTLWRYREALPVTEERFILSMGEGFTPLVEMEFEGHRVLVKMDFLCPTGSYKDRGASVLVSKARELGIEKVVEDSSGNAGSAIAAYCAKAGIACEIYVPGATSAGKLVQIEAYGASLRRIEGPRERAAEAAMEAASRAYYASHCWNPYFFHGTKTFAFEVWEQLDGRLPDALVLPVGHGTLFLGAYLGFCELREAGFIRRVPRLVGVQSESCAPLFEAFKQGREESVPIEKKETVAEGIAIAQPVRGRQILAAARETGGEMISVTEEEITEALGQLCRAGYFVEPTSAATIAGLKKYVRHIKRIDIVSTLTGTGLKASEKIGHLLHGS